MQIDFTCTQLLCVLLVEYLLHLFLLHLCPHPAKRKQVSKRVPYDAINDSGVRVLRAGGFFWFTNYKQVANINCKRLCCAHAHQALAGRLVALFCRPHVFTCPYYCCSFRRNAGDAQREERTDENGRHKHTHTKHTKLQVHDSDSVAQQQTQRHSFRGRASVVDFREPRGPRVSC